MRNRFTFLSFVLLWVTVIFSQNRQADSLKKLLISDKEDTLKIEHLNRIANLNIYIGNLDSGLYYSLMALDLSERLRFPSGLSNSHGNIGLVKGRQGNYTEAIDHFNVSINIDIKRNYKKGIANNNVRLGSVYWNMGNYPLALEHFIKGLKIYEEINFKEGMSMALGNIGIIYWEQKNYLKAEEYYKKALKIEEELGSKMGMSYSLGYLAGVYNDLGDTKKAMDYYLRSLQITDEFGNKIGSAKTMGNIAVLLRKIGDQAVDPQIKEQNYIKALEYNLKALKISEEIGDLKSQAVQIENMGGIYLSQKKFKLAEENLLKALKICKEIGVLEGQMYVYEGLGRMYFDRGDKGKSLEYVKLFHSIKDSLYNKEKDQEITRHEMKYEYEKREAVAKAEQEKKEAVYEAEASKQKTIIFLVSGVLILVIVFTLVVFRSLRLTRKQKSIIEQKNKETEVQKTIIEEKNKNIMDSIRYAQRIQNSLMPTEKFIEKKLKR